MGSFKDLVAGAEAMLISSSFASSLRRPIARTVAERSSIGTAPAVLTLT